MYMLNIVLSYVNKHKIKALNRIYTATSIVTNWLVLSLINIHVHVEAHDVCTRSNGIMRTDLRNENKRYR
jgi:hypothetical protein